MNKHQTCLFWGFIFLASCAIFGHAVNDQNGAWKMLVVATAPTACACWLIGWASKWQRIAVAIFSVLALVLMHLATKEDGGMPAVAKSNYDIIRRFVLDLPPAPLPNLQHHIRYVPVHPGNVP